jgi:hypothetical protein
VCSAAAPSPRRYVRPDEVGWCTAGAWKEQLRALMCAFCQGTGHSCASNAQCMFRKVGLGMVGSGFQVGFCHLTCHRGAVVQQDHSNGSHGEGEGPQGARPGQRHPVDSCAWLGKGGSMECVCFVFWHANVAQRMPLCRRCWSSLMHQCDCHRPRLPTGPDTRLHDAGQLGRMRQVQQCPACCTTFLTTVEGPDRLSRCGCAAQHTAMDQPSSR